MYIWEEGNDKWIWPADESVPRYVGSQISRDEVVNILNTSETQQAEINKLKNSQTALAINTLTGLMKKEHKAEIDELKADRCWLIENFFNNKLTTDDIVKMTEIVERNG